MTPIPAEVEDLKKQANALFAKKDFPAADAQYTSAIDLLCPPGDNPKHLDTKTQQYLGVLHGNRAANRSSMVTKKDADKLKLAIDDAWMSVELHGQWCKGLLRLGRLLGRDDQKHEAVRILTRALATATELNDPLKGEIAEELKKAEFRTLNDVRKDNGNLFLDKMKRKRDQSFGMLYPAPWSFASAVLETWSDFDQGIEMAKKLEIVYANGETRVSGGVTGGLNFFANAVLGNPNGLALRRGDDKLIQDYMFYECYVRGAVPPPYTQSADEIVAILVSKKGTNPEWSTYRPIYSSTIRATIVLSWLHMVCQKSTEALELITLADNLIKKFQHVFRNESVEDKGACLKASFHRLVRIFRALLLSLKDTEDSVAESIVIRSQVIAELEATGNVEDHYDFLYKRMVLVDAHAGLAGIHNSRFNKSIKFKPNLDRTKIHSIPDRERVESPHVDNAFREYSAAVDLIPVDSPDRVMYLHFQLRYALLKGIRYGDAKKIYAECLASVDKVDVYCKSLVKLSDDLRENSTVAFCRLEEKFLKDVTGERKEGDVLEDLILGPAWVATTNYYQN
ncbi:hypothetical protein HDU98_006846 [Podochytrium sp. JEL0797]|nr:hypothetical protein HDU98_006846 [Podochytrium sp. JEL0797]